MFSLTGCSSAIKNATTLPTAEAQTSAPSSQEYRIQPGDELNIKIFYNPELNESQIVRPDGRIALQLASEIVAAGLTPSELTTVLEKRYADELEKPEITVIVRSFNGQRFFVDGEVSRPGLFTLIGPTTVLDSIVQAGGFKDTARRHEIVIIRRGVDKKPIVFSVNLNDVINLYTGQNVGAVVLASDGIYNKGANPPYNPGKSARSFLGCGSVVDPR